VAVRRHRYTSVSPDPCPAPIAARARHPAVGEIPPSAELVRRQGAGLVLISSIAAAVLAGLGRRAAMVLAPLLGAF
jgi:hypothetical protein